MSEILETLDASYAAPRNPLEEEISRIWLELLEVPRLGIHDDFFELGGDSLLAIEIRVRVRKALGAPLVPADVAATPTVASMAHAIFKKLTEVAAQNPQAV
jgi:acyl carrier protein